MAGALHGMACRARRLKLHTATQLGNIGNMERGTMCLNTTQDCHLVCKDRKGDKVRLAGHYQRLALSWCELVLL